MAVVSKTKRGFSVNAYAGDAKTLLAFNLDKVTARNLAGFTIQCAPDSQPPYYIHNQLRFETPGDHAQDAKEPPNSSINAPIHKFRWVHVPGSAHQGIRPFLGNYTYTITPRYFDDKQSLLPLDATRSVVVSVDVVPFRKRGLDLGFTRGFTQSQAFVNHFGLKAPIRPKAATLLFDTGAVAGASAAGQTATFADEYEWLGFTARERIFDMLNEVVGDASLRLDMFAYDLNEPDILALLLKLSSQGRLRIILDNAALHHSSKKPTAEDQFEKLFLAKKKGRSAILRAHFGRFAHDKVMIVSGAAGPLKALSGSTNFSVTGMYVNSNHVVVFNDAKVADQYAQLFEAAWSTGAKAAPFQKSPLSQQQFTFSSSNMPEMEISFAPHSAAYAATLMGDIAKRIAGEGRAGKATASVLFAVMDLSSGDGPVRPALIKLHADQSVFSYGISDSSEGIRLYSPGRKTGVLVTGKPTNTILPPPFNQVPGVGLGHQVHHKFVVCGFNSPDAVVYCGSSNLASGGEAANGDNLIAIHDTDVATAFAIEALLLVDHFNFLDKYAHAPKGKGKAPSDKSHAASEAEWFLSTTDKWTAPYFDPRDLHCVDRTLFG